MAANTSETKAILESEHLEKEKVRNNILPDSKLEIINESTIEMNFILKGLKVETLTEKDVHFLVEFLLSPYTYYSNIDLSQCSEKVIHQIIDVVLSREDSEYGIVHTFTKMQLYRYPFPGSQFLASLKNFERQELSDINNLLKIFNELWKQIECTFQKEMAQVFSKSLFDECLKLIERSSTLHENPASVIEHLTFAAIALYKQHGSFDNKISNEQYKLWEQLLIDCFTITDKEVRYSALRLFRQELYNKDTRSFVCLAQAKRRFYVAALAFSAFAGNKPVLIKHFSSLSLYRQGAYNRVFVEALILLALDNHISSQNKMRLVEHLVKITKNNDERTVHYKAWTLLLTLIKSKVSSQIEELLKGISDESLLEDLFWKLFSDTLKVSFDARKLYQKHFNHPLHHLFFGYRQNMIQHGLGGPWGHDEQNKFDHFLIAVMQKGSDGFRDIRYDESINPHLCSVFHGETGGLIKLMWCKQVEPIALQQGILNNCTLHCSDDYWDLFTWAIGINCLEPLWGQLYIAAHLLNGQHKVVLLKDPQGQVIGGYLFHLLLTNPHAPKPILAVGKSYIRDGYDLQQKHEIQDALDTMSKKVSEMMNLPLVAILTSDADKDMHRKIAKEENPAGIFTKPGYLDVTGLDYDWYVYASRKEVAGYKRVIFEYQRLFTPAIKLADDLKHEHEEGELTADSKAKAAQTTMNQGNENNLDGSTLTIGFKESITALNQEFAVLNSDRLSNVGFPASDVASVPGVILIPSTLQVPAPLNLNSVTNSVAKEHADQNHI